MVSAGGVYIPNTLKGKSDDVRLPVQKFNVEILVPCLYVRHTSSEPAWTLPARVIFGGKNDRQTTTRPHFSSPQP
jgi:hypothetical protein